MNYNVTTYRSIKGLVEMPSLRPVRISTSNLSWFGTIKQYFKARKWEVIEDYKLYIPWLKETLLIPKGYIFDAASIPRFLWPLINPTGILLIPSLFHDFSYEFNGFLNDKKEKIHVTEEHPRAFFDMLFRDIGVYVNGINSVPNIAYRALQICGSFPWNRHRKISNKIEDFFEVILPEQLFCEYQESELKKA